MRFLKEFRHRIAVPVAALCGGVALLIPSPASAQSGPPPNDNFAQAVLWQDCAGTNSAALLEATTEPGEPPHLDGQPCKSVWWQWQAPVRSTAGITNIGATASNVTLAVYAGASLDTLTLVAKGAGSVRFNTTGGVIYHIAAAVVRGDDGVALLDKLADDMGFFIAGNVAMNLAVYENEKRK